MQPDPHADSAAPNAPLPLTGTPWSRCCDRWRWQGIGPVAEWFGLVAQLLYGELQFRYLLRKRRVLSSKLSDARACLGEPDPQHGVGRNPGNKLEQAHGDALSVSEHAPHGTGSDAVSAELEAARVLIAANLELLAALIAMEHEFGRTYLPGSSPAVDAARAAIAKAIGITP